MGKELLHHTDRTAKVDVDLAGDILQRPVFAELEVAHDPCVVHQHVELGKRAVTSACNRLIPSASPTSLLRREGQDIGSSPPEGPYRPACSTGEGGSSADATCDRGGKEEE